MKKFAVFGNPINQSLSPTIHSDFAKQAGIDILYEKKLSTLDDFTSDLVTFFENEEVIGCNVTSPFKDLAFQFADSHGQSSQDAKAANTLHRLGNQIIAYTTDGAGLTYDLVRLNGSLKGAKVLLLGAGGAARGVVRPLLEEGVDSLIVANRTEEKAKAIVNLFNDNRLTSCSLMKIEEQFDLVINSTSASLSNRIPETGKLDFAKVGLVYDMSYKAEPTAFLKCAMEKGSQHCVDGLGMLVGQAAVSFEIWTGFLPQTETVLNSLRKTLC